MKKTAKLIALLLAVCIITCTFTGCPPKLPVVKPHQSVYDLEAKLALLEAGAGTTKANMYFDNTESMYGFICEGTGQQSKFAIACQNIFDVVKGYKEYSVNALVPDSNRILHWGSVGADGFAGFRGKDFYSFNGDGPYDGNFVDGNTGPLKLLFSDDTSVNFDELNIIITDLAEQGLNNKLLAEKINEIAFANDNLSVALYCIESYFSGKAWLPQSGVTQNGSAKLDPAEYSGNRPFYCLIVGPSIEVVALCETLDGVLRDSGLYEGTDFNSMKVMARRGLTYAPINDAEYLAFDDMYAADDEKGGNDYEEYSSITIDNSNFNYNVRALSNYDEIFPDIDRKLPGLCYVYNPEYSAMQDVDFGKASISFMVNLPNLADGSVANPDEIEYAFSTGDIKMYGCKLVEETVTDEYGDEDEVNEKWVWEEISYNDLFESSDPYITHVQADFWANGEQIDRVSDYATNQDLKDEEYPKDQLELYTVDNESGAFRVRLTFDNMDELLEEKGYQYITLTGKVTGYRDVDANIPSWISKYDLPDTATPASTPDFARRTAGLDDFYTYLIGRMSSVEQKNEFRSHMTKTITDAVITVCLDESLVGAY